MSTNHPHPHPHPPALPDREPELLCDAASWTSSPILLSMDDVASDDGGGGHPRTADGSGRLGSGAGFASPFLHVDVSPVYLHAAAHHAATGAHPPPPHLAMPRADSGRGRRRTPHHVSAAGDVAARPLTPRAILLDNCTPLPWVDVSAADAASLIHPLRSPAYPPALEPDLAPASRHPPPASPALDLVPSIADVRVLTASPPPPIPIPAPPAVEVPAMDPLPEPSTPAAAAVVVAPELESIALATEPPSAQPLAPAPVVCFPVGPAVAESQILGIPTRVPELDATTPTSPPRVAATASPARASPVRMASSDPGALRAVTPIAAPTCSVPPSRATSPILRMPMSAEHSELISRLLATNFGNLPSAASPLLAGSVTDVHGATPKWISPAVTPPTSLHLAPTNNIELSPPHHVDPISPSSEPDDHDHDDEHLGDTAVLADTPLITPTSSIAVDEVMHLTAIHIDHGVVVASSESTASCPGSLSPIFTSSSTGATAAVDEQLHPLDRRVARVAEAAAARAVAPTPEMVPTAPSTTFAPTAAAEPAVPAAAESSPLMLPPAAMRTASESSTDSAAYALRRRAAVAHPHRRSHSLAVTSPAPSPPPRRTRPRTRPRPRTTTSLLTALRSWLLTPPGPLSWIRAVLANAANMASFVSFSVAVAGVSFGAGVWYARSIALAASAAAGRETGLATVDAEIANAVVQRVAEVVVSHGGGSGGGGHHGSGGGGSAPWWWPHVAAAASAASAMTGAPVDEVALAATAIGCAAAAAEETTTTATAATAAFLVALPYPPDVWSVLEAARETVFGWPGGARRWVPAALVAGVEHVAHGLGMVAIAARG
ncbi:hypothetical protein H9P43_001833 [Blastocladiella emersonii ATCC 22665]|nr:hypothetical protein H9P43_001833 [Blastocladiella emersonii ATCC 22665]